MYVVGEWVKSNVGNLSFGDSIEFPSITKFKSIVKANQPQIFPIIVSDIDRDDAFFGPQVGILKVKSV